MLIRMKVKSVLSLVFLLALGVGVVFAQQESPLDAKSRAALIDELKGVVSRMEPDAKKSALVAAKWDKRTDLSGKTKGEVIDLLYDDVESVISDSGTRYQINSLFSFYKGIPEESIGSGPAAPAAKRIKNPATAKGTIGGESHDSYVVRVRKNQTLNVQISWKAKDNNRAEFFISKSPDFFAGDAIQGVSGNGEKNWHSKIKKTGDYYIYVTAHPIADYVLKVSVK